MLAARVRSMVSGSSLLRRGLDDVQRAHLGAALGSAVSDVLAVVRRLPPVERDRAVLGKLVGIDQHFVFAVDAFADVEHRLVLLAFAAGVEVVLAANLASRRGCRSPAAARCGRAACSRPGSLSRMLRV